MFEANSLDMTILVQTTLGGKCEVASCFCACLFKNRDKD